MSSRKARKTAESRNGFPDGMTRKAIDAEFSQMANDPAYQEEALQVSQEFAGADWEALQAAVRRRRELPLVECAHEARPDEEMTPDRLEKALLEEEAGVRIHSETQVGKFQSG